MKTPFAKASELQAQWHVIDASGQPLGRMATEVARLLQGKHKVNFSPNLNMGDFVVVINASKVHLTGKKAEQKEYQRYSGYHGGLRRISYAEMIETHPERVIAHAVKGMLPKNRLASAMLKRLKVYGGGTHPHQAQVSSGSKAKPKGEERETTPPKANLPSPQEEGTKGEVN